MTTSLKPPAFHFYQGDTPLFVSMPHSGTHLTDEVQAGLTHEAQLLPDTDWFIPELYSFLAALGVGFIQANYSRFVIDLNRPYDDKPLYQTKTTGLFPDILFANQPIFYKGQEPSPNHRQFCKDHIWQPYHQAIEQELTRLKNKFGYAILFDAHSIAAQVPMLFDGTLPDFNWGTNSGASCDMAISRTVSQMVTVDYSQITDGRFKGGYITRHFGQPDQGIHAIQLELSQATYLDEALTSQHEYKLDRDKYPVIQQQLNDIINALLKISV